MTSSAESIRRKTSSLNTSRPRNSIPISGCTPPPQEEQCTNKKCLEERGQHPFSDDTKRNYTDTLRDFFMPHMKWYTPTQPSNPCDISRCLVSIRSLRKNGAFIMLVYTVLLARHMSSSSRHLHSFLFIWCEQLLLQQNNAWWYSASSNRVSWDCEGYIRLFSPLDVPTLSWKRFCWWYVVVPLSQAALVAANCCFVRSRYLQSVQWRACRYNRKSDPPGYCLERRVWSVALRTQWTPARLCCVLLCHDKKSFVSDSTLIEQKDEDEGKDDTRMKWQTILLGGDFKVKRIVLPGQLGHFLSAHHS